MSLHTRDADPTRLPIPLNFQFDYCTSFFSKVFFHVLRAAPVLRCWGQSTSSLELNNNSITLKMSDRELTDDQLPITIVIKICV